MKQTANNAMHALLYYYEKQLREQQSVGQPLQAGDQLPPLYTNNQQLAEMLGCHPNSVINHRNKLEEIGLIEKQVFRGKYHNYAIYINPAILHIQSRGGYANEVGQFRNFKGQLVANLNPQLSQNLGPSVTRTYQVTKELIELSGEDFSQVADSQSSDPARAVEKGEKAVENAVGNVKNPPTSVGQGAPLVTAGTGNATNKTEGDPQGPAPLTGNTPPELRGTPPTLPRHPSCRSSHGYSGCAWPSSRRPRWTNHSENQSDLDGGRAKSVQG